MWVNGMMYHDNPLAHGGVDEEPFDFEYYGTDPHGSTSLDNDNNVVVDEINLGENELLASFALETVDPLKESNCMGIDIFQDTLALVSHKLDQLVIT